MIHDYSSLKGDNLLIAQQPRTGRQSNSTGTLSTAVEVTRSQPLPKMISPQGELTTDTFKRIVNVDGIPVTYINEEGGLGGVHVLGSTAAKKLVRTELANAQNDLERTRVLGQLEQSIQHVPHGEVQRSYGQSIRDVATQELGKTSPKLKSLFSKSVKHLLS
jgi:hypothetical protein